MSAMIQFPLDLPDVEVLKTELSAKGHLVITVESTREGTRCRRCGQEIKESHGHDRPLPLAPSAGLGAPGQQSRFAPSVTAAPIAVTIPPLLSAVAGMSLTALIPEPSSSR